MDKLQYDNPIYHSRLIFEILDFLYQREFAGFTQQEIIDNMDPIEGFYGKPKDTEYILYMLKRRGYLDSASDLRFYITEEGRFYYLDKYYTETNW